MLDLVFNNFTSAKAPDRQFFYTLFQKSAKSAGLPLSGSIEVSLNFVGEARMKSLNKKHRSKNKVTDVLSFPLDGKTDDKSAIMLLGDIFVCLPFAKKEAVKENIAIDRKLSQLAVHGFLHLLGYDHEKSEAERRKMEELEKEILVNNK